MQAYSDPKRESDPHALPDLEVFEVTAETPLDECPHCQGDPPACDDQDEHEETHCGFYWWSCFPGCLPDGDAFGPFATAEEALADAREDVEEL